MVKQLSVPNGVHVVADGAARLRHSSASSVTMSTGEKPTVSSYSSPASVKTSPTAKTTFWKDPPVMATSVEEQRPYENVALTTSSNVQPPEYKELNYIQVELKKDQSSPGSSRSRHASNSSIEKMNYVEIDFTKTEGLHTTSKTVSRPLH